MKSRNGFVSNSSSSSYIIRGWSKLTIEQQDAIKDYDNACIGWCLVDGIELTPIGEGYSEDMIGGRQADAGIFGYVNNECRHEFLYDKENDEMEIYAYMENFEMEEWLKHIGVEFETMKKGG